MDGCENAAFNILQGFDLHFTLQMKRFCIRTRSRDTSWLASSCAEVFYSLRNFFFFLARTSKTPLFLITVTLSSCCPRLPSQSSLHIHPLSLMHPSELSPLNQGAPQTRTLASIKTFNKKREEVLRQKAFHQPCAFQRDCFLADLADFIIYYTYLSRLFPLHISTEIPAAPPKKIVSYFTKTEHWFSFFHLKKKNIFLGISKLISS